MNRHVLPRLALAAFIPCAVAAVTEPAGISAALTEGGAPVGTHGAGPVWESTSDRSRVKGTVKQRQDGGAGNIPWLLLSGSSTEGTGKFAGVTSVQRVATKGGVEPAEACDASKVGQEARVPYAADYYFYRRK